MNDTATVARLLRKSFPRVEVDEQAYQSMRAIIFDKLNIASSVAAVERVADENDSAIKRVMKCHKPECAGRRCEADCV